MSFTVLTWNVQRWCAGSPAMKTQFILAQIAQYAPDLLGLTEIGDSIANTVGLIPNYSCVGYANTLDKNFDGSNLCIAWFVSAGYGGRFTKARALHNLEQRRAKLKVNMVDPADGSNYQLYLVHADASKKGGEGEVTEAAAEVVKYDKVVYVGDMNYDFNKDTKGLQGDGNLNLLLPREPTGEVVKYSQGTHYKGKLLDGAITASTTVAKAKKNITGRINWSFATTDHMPVFMKIG